MVTDTAKIVTKLLIGVERDRERLGDGEGKWWMNKKSLFTCVYGVSRSRERGSGG